MIRRPGAIAIARAVNALFFLTLSVYCFLDYTPFAYDAFIKPGHSHALWFFIVIAPALYWVTLLITALTLLPQLQTRGVRGRAASWAYFMAGLVAGFAVIKWPLMNLGHRPAAFWFGMAWLLGPIGLAIVDHRVWPRREVRHLDSDRALTACLTAAGLACATYATAAPLRMAQVVGVDLTTPMMAAAVGWSFIAHEFIFVAWFLAILTVARIATAIRVSAVAEYWLLMVPVVVGVAAALKEIVWLSVGFLGFASVACSAALAVTIAAVWADLARLRSQTSAPDAIDSLGLLSASVAGLRSGVPAMAVIAVVSFSSNVIVSLVKELDWNFVFQKLTVLATWVAIFCATYSAIGAHRRQWAFHRQLIGVPIVALLLFQSVAWVGSKAAVDRYAAVDLSVRLIHDARVAESAETEELYAYLRSQTLVEPDTIRPPAVDLVRPFAPATARRPHIFLLLIDSLRRDYLSSYNPKVTFTPQIAKLAEDSFVFERAWTRYSGTMLAVPSIWAGGMVPHGFRQPQFHDRDPLLKLLDGNDYRRMMDTDVVVETFDLRDERLIELNPGHELWAATDFCTTVDAFQRYLPKDRSRPTFFYSLAENIHPTVALERKVPPGETYSEGFDARVASSLHRVDACFGRFMDVLKRERLYDDSIIIVTSDHGDLLGEEGRWGHSFWLYPEVMQIPLIVHLPAWLKPAVRADLDARVFSTDITPSLYTLLGYKPADLGPLFGRSFFTPRDGDSSWRRRETSLVASSYGAVYGIVSQNGRRLYVVDTVDATEYAMDLTHEQRRLTVTPEMMAVNRRTIADQLRALAKFYRSDQR